MALKQKVEQSDLYLYEILRNPVLCTEFINNIDKLEYEERFEFTWYQREMLCDFNPYVSYTTARSVGKTVALVSLITWVLINEIFPVEGGNANYCTYHAPGKAHVEPVFTGLERSFKTNSFLKNFLGAGKSGINRSDFAIKLVNGASLLCRIAGQTGTGQAVIGLHSPFVITDESGYYPWATFMEMQPTLNTFTSGARMLVAGVPTGLRENNVCYHVDQENSEFTKHRLSALQNPRFTEEDHQKAIITYGGVDSEDYTHLVLGEHGKPVYALFDRELMEIDKYPVHKLVLDGLKLSKNLNDYYTKLALLPSLPTKSTECIMGVDLGYTEPTAIFILYFTNSGQMKFLCKIRLNKVDYYIQEKIIDYIDTKYNPFVLGVDEGSAGKSVIPRLQNHDDFIHKEYNKRLIPINFSSQIVLGIDADGNEIKDKTKPFAVSVLQEYTNNHKILYSYTDTETIVELERMTYTKTPSGEIVYRTLTERGGKKGEDHFSSALLCASLAHYLAMESLEFRARKKRLANASWFIGG